MTDSIKDGGAAFPIAWMQYTQQGYIVPQGKNEGMSLRDYFAGQVLISIRWLDLNSKLEDIAIDCYKIADAMLKAREAKP